LYGDDAGSPYLLPAPPASPSISVRALIVHE